MQAAINKIFLPFSATYSLHILAAATENDMEITLKILPAHYDLDVYGKERVVIWDASNQTSPAKVIKDLGLEVSLDSSNFRNATSYAILVVRKNDKRVIATRRFGVVPSLLYGEGQGSWVSQEARASDMFHVLHHAGGESGTQGQATSLSMVLQSIYFCVLKNHSAGLLHARADWTNMSDAGWSHAFRSGFRLYEAGRLPHPTNANAFMSAKTHEKDYYLALKEVDKSYEKQSVDLYRYLLGKQKISHRA